MQENSRPHPWAWFGCSVVGQIMGRGLGRLSYCVVHLDALSRFAPRLANMFCPTANFTILVQISVDEVEEKLRRVGLCGNRVADPVEICGRFYDGAEVTGLSSGQEAEFIKLLESRRRRLVDGRNDDELELVNGMHLFRQG